MLKKYVTLILLSVIGIGSASASASSYSLMMQDEFVEQSPSISVHGNKLHVLHAEGQVLEIYNVTGIKVASYKIETQNQTILHSLNRGCYIMKIGKVVRKISVE